MLFSSGAYDGRATDGTVHFLGEHRPPGELRQGNKAVREAASRNRTLHLFAQQPHSVMYAGQVDLDPTGAFEADLSGNDDPAVVFRLRPHDPPATARVITATAPLHLAEHETRTHLHPGDPQRETQPSTTGTSAQQVARRLVSQYRETLRQRGERLTRPTWQPAGEGEALIPDGYVPESHTLIHAIGTPTREAARLALGTLLDQRRGWPDARLLVLSPSAPRESLLTLLASASVRVTWPDDAGHWLSSDR